MYANVTHGGIRRAAARHNRAGHNKEVSFRIVEVPFHMGVEQVAVGRGPAQFVAAGADRVLSTGGIPAEVLHVQKRDSTTTGLDAIVDLNRQVRYAVRAALAEGVAPIVLSGNCNSCLGTLAGIGEQGAAPGGIVWLDAHGDFNTPESSISGNLDGMALAAAVGLCHHDLAQRIGLEAAVAPGNVLLLGCHDLDPGEPERLAAAGVTVRRPHELRDVTDALHSLGERAGAIYLHIDIDFLTGVTLAEGESLLRAILESVPVAAIALTNYNPGLDDDARIRDAGLHLLGVVAHVLLTATISGTST